MHFQYITLAKNSIDITDQKFGRLTAIGPVDRAIDGNIRWHCRCDCGKETLVAGTRLRFGHSTSCGCYRREGVATRSTSHGMSRSKEYQAWSGMIQRCHDPKHIGYKDRLDRGITVCDEWRHSFADFYEHIGPMPFPKATVDRINNDLGYFHGNVKWSTSKEQARNRRDNVNITFGGRTQCLSIWADELRIGRSTLRRRMALGWDIDRAFTQPVKKRQ